MNNFKKEFADISVAEGLHFGAGLCILKKSRMCKVLMGGTTI